MSTVNGNQGIELVSDGHQLIIGFGGTVICAEGFFLTEMNTIANNNFISVDCDFGGSHRIFPRNLFMELELKLQITGPVTVHTETNINDLELGRDMFKNLSIGELLDAVNRKINDLGGR